jgi:hypothetical protein
MINQEEYGSNPENCQQKQMLGSCSTRFSKDIPDFMGFKRFCSGVLQNLVRDAECPGVFLCHKNTSFLTMRTKILTLTQRKKTYRFRIDMNQATMRKQWGMGVGGRYVDLMITETAKGEERQ